jgi:NAD(P)-dependent dehydrogenase (short-subunit alcohol dehydrogenase family)
VFHSCDIGDEEDIKRALAATSAKFGDKIHVLVNNAACFIFLRWVWRGG